MPLTFNQLKETIQFQEAENQIITFCIPARLDYWLAYFSLFSNKTNVHGFDVRLDWFFKNQSLISYFLGELQILSSNANTTSFFSYEWIEYHSLINTTGICMKFLYKMNGDNNTLEIYFKSSKNQTQNLVWMLKGNHGNMWNNGTITYWPKEPLSVITINNLHRPRFKQVASITVCTAVF